jgi:hypothetical protein
MAASSSAPRTYDLYDLTTLEHTAGLTHRRRPLLISRCTTTRSHVFGACKLEPDDKKEDAKNAREQNENASIW